MVSSNHREYGDDEVERAFRIVPSAERQLVKQSISKLVNMGFAVTVLSVVHAGYG